MLRTDGFALPTVIIASLIMLTVLITSVTAVNSITTTLAGQYYNQQAREAAESGLAVVRACLRYYNYAVPGWTAPVTPNSNCSGGPNTTPAYVINSGNVRSSFSVPPPPPAGVGGTLRITATGTVQLVRTSNPSQVWRTYTYVAAENIRYNDFPQIAGGAGWKDPSFGSGYSGHNGYMLAGNGTLYGWGDNAGQQLGDLSMGTTVSLPAKIALPSGTNKVKKVMNSGQGASILCIIATHDTLGDQLYCRGTSGASTPGLMPATPGTGWTLFGLPAGLTALSGSQNGVNGYGTDSVCAVASDNQAYCAGPNNTGGLGNAINTGAFVPFASPTKFRLDLASPGPVSGSASSLTVKKVFNQDRFTCVIASDDQAYCAGDNDFGQLGQGTTTITVSIGKSTPGRAIIPGAPIVADIKLPYHAGVDGVFFLDAGSTMWMSGSGGAGNANDGRAAGPCGGYACYTTPRSIGFPVKSMISVGQQGNQVHSMCVPVSSGDFYCSGGTANAHGQTGRTCGTVTGQWNSPIPLGGEVSLLTLNNEAGYQMNSTMTITTAGNVYAAGDNTYGKLGTGAALGSCNNTFAKVQLPAGVKAVALANGDEYTAFILGDDGKVYAMGRNNNGQLGNGTTTNSSVPVEVQIPRQETIY